MKHAETFAAVMAHGCSAAASGGAGEEAYTTQSVIDAHCELDEAYRGLADSRVSEIADVVRRARLQQGMTAEQRSAFRLRDAMPAGSCGLSPGVPVAGKTF